MSTITYTTRIRERIIDCAKNSEWCLCCQACIFRGESMVQLTRTTYAHPQCWIEHLEIVEQGHRLEAELAKLHYFAALRNRREQQWNRRWRYWRPVSDEWNLSNTWNLATWGHDSECKAKWWRLLRQDGVRR